MQYKNFTVKDTRGDPLNSFVIGPSFAFKPTARMRFDVAPLIGVTDDSPDLQVFAIFSYVFGGGSESGAKHRPRLGIVRPPAHQPDQASRCGARVPLQTRACAGC